MSENDIPEKYVAKVTGLYLNRKLLNRHVIREGVRMLDEYRREVARTQAADVTRERIAGMEIILTEMIRYTDFAVFDEEADLDRRHSSEVLRRLQEHVIKNRVDED